MSNRAERTATRADGWALPPVGPHLGVTRRFIPPARLRGEAPFVDVAYVLCLPSAVSAPGPGHWVSTGTPLTPLKAFQGPRTE